MGIHVKSPKELALEKKLLALLDGSLPSGKLARLLIKDPEIAVLQDYGNTVSIVRLGFNDHGPVHMRQVARNAVLMMQLLKEASVPGSLEHDKVGSYDDSLAALLLASFLHDVGMAIGRQDHELLGATIALPIIDRLLLEIYPLELEKRVIIRSVAIEGIIGHMANRKIHSIEAGVILLADGCDMEKGRARIPIALSTEPKIGDIHKYSANSIEQVIIRKGERKPICIEVEMSTAVGFFQVEEVLFPKINSSPVKPYIELIATVAGEEQKHYL